MQLTQTNQKLYRVGLYDVINEGVNNPAATSGRISNKVIRSKQAYEEFLTQTGLGLFIAKGEGENATMDRARTRFNPTYTPLIYELGVEYSRQSKHKDMYGFIKMHGKMLADAWIMTRNFNYAMALQGGFSGGTQLTPDGLSVFNTAHTLADGSTQSNVGTDDLNGLTIATTVQNIMSQLGDRGLPVTNAAERFKLVHGPGLWGISHRAIESNQLQGSADNDTNKHIQATFGEPIMDRFLGFNDTTLADAWYVLPQDDDKNPLFRLHVADLDTRVDQEVRSGNIVMVASAEELVAWIGWRNVYANNP